MDEILIVISRMPPTWMIEMGKQSPEFFEKVTDEYGRKTYRLKSMEKYSREHKTNEQPSKRYFSATTFPDIVTSYPMPKRNMKPTEIEREMQNRMAFIDFVQRLLNMNPVERWTPQQAKMHHFVATQKPYSASSTPNSMQHQPQQSQSMNEAAYNNPTPNYSYQVVSDSIPAAGSKLHPDSYYAPAPGVPSQGANVSQHTPLTASSNPYPPQKMHAGSTAVAATAPMMQSMSSRSGRPRAVTIGHMDPIPPQLQRVSNLIDPANAIRAQPSPAYFPPPELEAGNSGSSSGGDIDSAQSGKRRSNTQHGRGDVIRNLEDGLSVSYWA